MYQQETAFENIVGQGEIACNKQFLLFSQCFLLNLIIASPFVHIFGTKTLFAAEWEEPKIGISGRGLIPDNKNLDLSLFKGFTDNTLLLYQMTKF